MDRRKGLKLISEFHVDSQFLQQYGNRFFQHQPEQEDSNSFKKELLDVVDDMIQQLEEIKNISS